MYVDQVDKTLLKIQRAEKAMSGSAGIKTALSKLDITNKAIGHYMSDIKAIEEEIEEIKSTKEKIKKKMERIKEEEKNIEENKDNNDVRNIRNMIEKIKKEMVRYDTEIGLLSSTCFGEYKGFEKNDKFNTFNIGNGSSGNKEDVDGKMFDEEIA